MLSLNQIVNKLNLIQVNHAQLNSFHFGDPWELEASENLQYPVFVTALLPGSLSKGIQTTKLYLAVADLVQRGEENETEVLSDTQLILMDCYAQLWEYFEENNIELSRDATFSPFTEKWDNAVSGWQLEVDVRQFYSRDTCQVPLRGIDTELDGTVTLTTSLENYLEANGTYILDDGSESDLFRVVMTNSPTSTGTITLYTDPQLDIYDGTQWVLHPSNVEIDYINNNIVTDEIYKIRKTGGGDLTLTITSTGLPTYQLLTVLP